MEEDVLGLDPGKLMGIAAHELAEEELGRLGSTVDTNYTGIAVDEVAADYPAVKGGMMKGDVLVKFDGKRFPRHDALNRMRIWMQDVPFGRGVRVTVLRDGKEVDLQLKWEEPKK